MKILNEVYSRFVMCIVRNLKQYPGKIGKFPAKIIMDGVLNNVINCDERM